MEQPQNVQDAMASAGRIIQDIDSLKTRVTKANSDRDGFKKRMRAITSDIISAINDIKGTNSALKSQIQTQASQIESKENELAELRKEGANNVANGDALANRMDRLGEQIKEKDQELSELKAELARNEEAKTLTDRELGEIKAEIVKLQGELTNARAELELSKTAQREMGQEMRRLEGQLVKTTEDVSKAYKELEASVITLLDDVESDEQEANLNRILRALKQNEESAIESASEVLPQIVTPAPEASAAIVQPPEGYEEFKAKFNQAYNRHFDENNNRITNYNAIKSEPPIKMTRAIVAYISNKDPEMKSKIGRYRTENGKLPIFGGGTRKRKRKGRNQKGKSRKTKKRHSSSTRRRSGRGKRKTRK